MLSEGENVMNEKKKEIFVGTLTQPYQHDRYVLFLRELLPKLQLIAPNQEQKPWNTFSVAVDHYRHIGKYVGEDQQKVALFTVCLYNDRRVENARTMQRSFVKTLLEASDCAGALVAFHTKDEPEKWRLSLVRLDYEFSKGKISEKLTPAKRYSYLVGKGEPCHTAQERLYPIFLDDENAPTLDELENAFSVEAVTKDFFDQYREKYLVLKEYLESNPQFISEAESRGFDSEQFAKKLMGQIVFLYFIQKKGWLGVNAFPAKMTEREYKASYWRTGTKPKELMPLVYKQNADGIYVRDNDALMALSEEDKTLLSTFVKGDKWGSGPKDFMRRIFEGCMAAGKNYFDDYLEPLFYTGLNRNRGENAFFPLLHRRIPFLNGGLFEELKGYQWESNDFSIPNEIFSNVHLKGRDADGILDVFDRFNFTMAEDEPMEREVAIDPEMLGKVFENLLDVKDRKSKGAFYTPREIVHYMCQESLINYLASRTGISDGDIRKFILYGEYFRDEDTRKTIFVKGEGAEKGHYDFDYEKELELPSSILSYKDHVNRLQELDDLLANVKMVDPAVGSGAFPLGMLTEIVKARETLTSYMTIEMSRSQRLSFRAQRNVYRLKRDTIKNCIFACDIEASATDITKLRLWLSLVIDNQIMDQEDDILGYSTKPRELPNLDCNIICGNSLMDEFKGIQLIKENAVLRNEASGRQMTTFDQDLGILITELVDLQSRLYDEKDHVAKDTLKGQIEDIYNQIVMEQISSNSETVDEYYQAIQMPSKPFVLWQLYFPKVFRDNGGFDIAIGNPPYISAPMQLSNDALSQQRDALSRGKRYKTLYQKWDLYIPFVELGTELVRDNGVVSMIIPYPYTNQTYAKKARELATTSCDLVEIVDLNDVKIFDTATVQNCIPIIRKKNYSGKTIISRMQNGTIVKQFTKALDQLVIDKKSYMWNLLETEKKKADRGTGHLLGDYCYLSVGMVVNADEKTAKGEFKKEDLISDIEDGTPRKPYLEAKDIDTCRIRRVRYLEYGTERSPARLRRPTFPELYNRPKLMFNCLGELKGTIDENGEFLHNHSIVACILWKDFHNVSNKSINSSIKKFSSLSRREMEILSESMSLYCLLGIMISSKGREYLDINRAGDYHIYPEHLRSIPIPELDKTEKEAVEAIVKEIIRINKTQTESTADLEDNLNDLVERAYRRMENG